MAYKVKNGRVMVRVRETPITVGVVDGKRAKVAKKQCKCSEGYTNAVIVANFTKHLH